MKKRKTGRLTKTTATTSKAITSEKLTSFLWTIMQDVKSGQMEPTAAKAVASAANTIVSTAKLNLAYMKYKGKKSGSVSGFLD